MSEDGTLTTRDVVKTLLEALVDDGKLSIDEAVAIVEPLVTPPLRQWLNNIKNDNGLVNFRNMKLLDEAETRKYHQLRRQRNDARRKINELFQVARARRRKSRRGEA